MSKGKLICIEALDAGGKGTQIEQISNYFKDKGLSFTHYHFPMYGHNQFSDVIAQFLRGEFGSIDEVDPLFVATIYAMDRFRFLPQLEKDLENNDVVLLDRYVYSNIAYQCAKYKDTEEADKMGDWIYHFEFDFLKLPYPDLNIFLDVPINIIKARLENKREGDDRKYLNGKRDIHEENIDFQSKVRDNYLKYMDGGCNCKIVQCANLGEDGYIVLNPKGLFDSYKWYLDFIFSI